jgi:hypothetical protein
MDYRIYKHYVRQLFSINLGLSLLYTLSFIILYFSILTSESNHYYIQTNTGFLFELQPVEEGQEPSVLKILFK